MTFPINDLGENATYVVEVGHDRKFPFWALSEWKDLVPGKEYLIIPNNGEGGHMTVFYSNTNITVEDWVCILRALMTDLMLSQIGAIRVLFNTGTEFKFVRVLGSTDEVLFNYSGKDSNLIEHLQ